LDFSPSLAQLIGPRASGSVLDTLDSQVYSTLFQFEEVNSVTLTMDGNCEAIGVLLMTGCQTIDRAL